jgi:hypothetical protein
MPEQIDEEWVTLLGLEALQAPETDEGLGSEAAIACSLRRAASFGAPITRQRLARDVFAATTAYVSDNGDLRARIGEVLDRLQIGLRAGPQHPASPARLRQLE